MQIFIDRNAPFSSSLLCGPTFIHANWRFKPQICIKIIDLFNFDKRWPSRQIMRSKWPSLARVGMDDSCAIEDFGKPVLELVERLCLHPHAGFCRTLLSFWSGRVTRLCHLNGSSLHPPSLCIIPID
ncbi:hypothetical protein VNO77_15097 [Canavalia gladiata]|uniref:Uncharacterized protein n=1 Tax=Canavalia gladiata TaxID=3824 RepID=A0AAN9M406_CANGL